LKRYWRGPENNVYYLIYAKAPHGYDDDERLIGDENLKRAAFRTDLGKRYDDNDDGNNDDYKNKNDNDNN